MLRRIRVRKVQIRALHQRQKAVAGNQAVLPRGADAQRTLTTSRMRVRPAAVPALGANFSPHRSGLLRYQSLQMPLRLTAAAAWQEAMTAEHADASLKTSAFAIQLSSAAC